MVDPSNLPTVESLQKKVCPACLEVFEGGVSLCPTDRSLLLPIDQGDPLLGRLIADRYLLLGRLGAGGMGVVYRAFQRGIEREVAVKILPIRDGQRSDLVERFLREARHLGRLTAPNTVIVHDAGQLDDGSLFIAMELLRGLTLKQVIDRDAPLAPARAVALLTQICASLEEAHRAGLVHRDLKPANVLVLGEPGAEKVKVLDFGISKLLGVPEPGLTGTGQVLGTPQYMSPEQCLGREDVGPAADLYALGVIAFEMLAGHSLFPEAQPLVVMMRHVKETPPRLADDRSTSPEHASLDRVVARCLEKRPEDRHPSASALSAQLSLSLEVESPPADATDVTPPLPELLRGPPAPRRGWLRWTAPLALGAILSVLLLSLDRREVVDHSTANVANDPLPRTATVALRVKARATERTPRPAAPGPKLSGLRFTGAIDQTAAKRALFEGTARWSKCIPATPGWEMKVYWVVRPNGLVTSATLIDTRGLGPRAVECLRGRMLEVVLPAFEGSAFSSVAFKWKGGST